MWRVGAIAAGLPVGAVAAWAAFGTPPATTGLAFGAGGGAVVLWLALAAGRRARLRASSAGRLRSIAAGVLALLLGASALVGIAAAFVARGEAGYRVTEPRAAAIFDLDAAIATRLLPRCAATPRHVEVLRDPGARPRMAGEGSLLWFDARMPDGRRQVQRLDRASGRAICWTCGEPGNNWRPAPASRGFGVAFETDRHAIWWDPSNTEIYLLDGRGERPDHASRRLTFAAGPDGYAVLGPATRLLVWSRREGAGYAVMSAPMRRVHGGLQLGKATVLESAGAAWTAPLAWSPDARALAVVRGNPFRPLSAHGIDLATGRSADLGSDVVLGGVAFGGDGGWMAVAGARRARLAGWLPAGLGFLLAPFADRLARDHPLYRESSLRTGEPRAPGAPLEIGAVATWGEPTGLALSPEGNVIVLGQRRVVAGRVEERLVEITLDCRT